MSVIPYKPSGSDNEFFIGQKIDVGEFFWVDDELCIGFDPDARHGHKLWFGGSVNVDDRLIVRGIEGDHLVVRVEKDSVPHGAHCPHGMVFIIPSEQVKSWPLMRARLAEIEKRRAALAGKYLTVEVGRQPIPKEGE